MNIINYIFSLLTGPVLILLFIMALIAILLPVKFISLKTKYPIPYYIVLTLGFLIQFPLLFLGCWGLGMLYAESKFGRIVDVSYLGLIILYISIFFLSSFIQGRKKEIKKISLGTALFTSLILSPAIYFACMHLFGKILLGK